MHRDSSVKEEAKTSDDDVLADRIAKEIDQLEIQHEPSKLDAAFDAAQTAPNAI